MNVFDKINRILEAKKKTETRMRTLTSVEKLELLRDRLKRARESNEPLSPRDRRARKAEAARRAAAEEKELKAHDVLDLNP